MAKVEHMDMFRYSLGQLQANCYFLVQDNKCIIIDPADDAAFILEELQRKNLQLVGMLATHGHFDHIMAVGEIQLSFDVPLYIFEEDQFLVDRLTKTADHFLEYKFVIVPQKKIQFLNEGEMKIENFKLKIIPTPGHTPGSCCYYSEEKKMVFTGDTLFKQVIGDYSHKYSSKTSLLKSLHKLFQLPGETLIYSGHGDVTSIENERFEAKTPLG